MSWIFVVRILVFHNGLKGFQNVNKQNFYKKIWMKKHTQWVLRSSSSLGRKGNTRGKEGKLGTARSFCPAQWLKWPKLCQKIMELKVQDFQKKIGIIYRLKQICRFTILNSSFEFSRFFCQYAGLWLAAIHHNQM